MAVTTGLAAEFAAATGDSTLIQRVEMAVLNAAQAVAAEATGTSNHANRVALCKAVTQPGASPGYAAAFTKLIFSTGTLDVSGTAAQQDTNIQSLVNACWNTVAGAL